MEKEVETCLFFLQFELNHVSKYRLLNILFLFWAAVTQASISTCFIWLCSLSYLHSSHAKPILSKHTEQTGRAVVRTGSGTCLYFKSSGSGAKGAAFSLQVRGSMRLNGDEWDMEHKQLLSLGPLPLLWPFSSFLTWLGWTHLSLCPL